MTTTSTTPTTSTTKEHTMTSQTAQTGKKLTKTQTLADAVKRADYSDLNAPLTVEQLEAMNYTERRTLANDRWLGQETLPLTYVEAAYDAFMDRLLGRWASQLKTRENARRNWKRLLAGVTTKTAEKEVGELLQSMRIRGMRFDGGSSYEVRRAGNWTEATLRVNFDTRWDEGKTENPDDATQRAYIYSAKVDVSWGSTTRTLSEATTVVKLYAELVEAAHEVQALLDRMTIVETYGIPEPAAEPSPVASMLGDHQANS